MEVIQGDKLRGHLEAMVLFTLERGEAHGLEHFHWGASSTRRH